MTHIVNVKGTHLRKVAFFSKMLAIQRRCEVVLSHQNSDINTGVIPWLPAFSI